MTVAIAFTTAVVVVLLLTPVVRYVGLQLGFVDRPGQRKVHRQSIVRIGGVAIGTATLLALGVSCWAIGLEVDTRTWGLVLGSMAFFLIGLSDDLLNLPPLPRLLLQALVAAIAWKLGVRVEAVPIPLMGAVPTDWLSLPITFLWLVGVTNAINWMDGLDGLAAGIGAIAAGFLGLACWHSEPLAAALAIALTGATLGFLRYNANPAQIFMGDGGSYFIGFVLAAVAAIGPMQQGEFTGVLLPYLVLAVPILDMTIVILGRLHNGKSPFFPDQRHLHHRLLQAGLTVRPTVSLMHSLTLWTGSWAFVLAGLSFGWLALLLSSGLLCITTYPLFLAISRSHAMPDRMHPSPDSPRNF